MHKHNRTYLRGLTGDVYQFDQLIERYRHDFTFPHIHSNSPIFSIYKVRDVSRVFGLPLSLSFRDLILIIPSDMSEWNPVKGIAEPIVGRRTLHSSYLVVPSSTPPRRPSPSARSLPPLLFSRWVKSFTRDITLAMTSEDSPHPPRPAIILAAYAVSLSHPSTTPSDLFSSTSRSRRSRGPLSLSLLSLTSFLSFRREKSGANIISLLFRSPVFLWVREDIMYLAWGPLFAILVVSRGEYSRLSPAMLGRGRRKRLTGKLFVARPLPPPLTPYPPFACVFAIVCVACEWLKIYALKGITAIYASESSNLNDLDTAIFFRWLYKMRRNK